MQINQYIILIKNEPIGSVFAKSSLQALIEWLHDQNLTYIDEAATKYNCGVNDFVAVLDNTINWKV